MKRLLYGMVMICFLDLFIQLPVMGPFAKSLGAGAFGIGLAVGLYSLTNMLGNIAAGLWIDRYGAKRVLASGFMLTACVLLLYPLAESPIYLIMIRFVHGLTGGLLVPSAFALVSGYADNRQQGKTMALSGAAVGAAAIIGPAMAGIVKAKLGLTPLFLGTSLLMVFGGLVILFGVRDSKEWRSGIINKQKLSMTSKQEKSPIKQGSAVFTDILRRVPVMQSYLAAFSLMLAMGALTYALPLKADELQFPAFASGFMLSTFGIVAIVFFLLPTNRYFDRVQPLKLVYGGGSLILLSLLLLSFASQMEAMFVIMGVYGVGFSFLFPSMNALLLKNVGEEIRGRAIGLFYAFFSLGVVAGSSGISAFVGHYDLVLRIAAILMLLAGVLVVFMPHYLKERYELNSE